MIIKGHTGIENDKGMTEFLELAEISVTATLHELRKMAEFLKKTAQHMEEMGEGYCHEHLSDCFKEFDNSPHFVTFQATE